MRPKLEVADIFRRHGDRFRAAQGNRLSLDQRKVMAAIEACRTPALGGHVERCEDCGETRISYNSCRDRHCPKCQGLSRLQWLADRRAELLPVAYFHVVFTVPAPVAAIALQNKALVYDILFKAAAETIRVIGADPKHLGAETGMVAILHTWGQTLTHHPHVHCIVPGGGLGPDGSWIASKPNFFRKHPRYARAAHDRFGLAAQAAHCSDCGSGRESAGLPIPGQQLVDPVDRTVGQPCGKHPRYARAAHDRFGFGGSGRDCRDCGSGRESAGLPIPGQQLVDPVDRMVGDAGEDVGEPGLRDRRR